MRVVGEPIKRMRVVGEPIKRMRVVAGVKQMRVLGEPFSKSDRLSVSECPKTAAMARQPTIRQVTQACCKSELGWLGRNGRAAHLFSRFTLVEAHATPPASQPFRSYRISTSTLCKAKRFVMSKSTKQLKVVKPAARISKALTLDRDKKIKRTPTAVPAAVRASGKDAPSTAKRSVPSTGAVTKASAENTKPKKSTAPAPLETKAEKPAGKKLAEPATKAGVDTATHAGTPPNQAASNEADGASVTQPFSYTTAMSSALEMHRQFAATLMFSPWAFSPWGRTRKE